MQTSVGDRLSRKKYFQVCGELIDRPMLVNVVDESFFKPENNDLVNLRPVKWSSLARTLAIYAHLDS